ncbi:MAG: hypothetical protein MRJ96_07580 [Nitrospirales bacterium]|nr:hypothetical protein [Nitrospira sp.]MDR4501293.1 hypothetical protein [Nitrospirales bacterium]
MALHVMVGCASTPEITWTESKSKPQWISQVPLELDFLYFVGSASRADSLESGIQSARHAALSKIAGYLGTDIESEFKMANTESEQNVGESLKANTKAFVVKAISVDFYHKKMTRIEGNSQLEQYDVFVLLKYPKREATEEFIRRQTKDESTVYAAYNLYQTGKEYEKENKFTLSKKYYRDALSLVGQVRTVVPLDEDDVADSQELAILLTRSEENVIRQLRRVVVWVVEKNHDQTNTPSILGAHLTAVLTKHLFTVLDLTPPKDFEVENVHQLELKDKKPLLRFLKSQGAQFLIAGNGNASSRSFTMNNFFYEAQGTLRVFDIATGDTILTLPIQQRGYDRNEKTAGMNALREAGKVAGELLVNEFLSREET